MDHDIMRSTGNNNNYKFLRTIKKQKIGFTEYRLEEHQLANGKTFQYDVFYIPPFAIIIPKNSDGKILMLKQYRPSWRVISLEFPAGVKDDSDNNLNVTALRELEEETGYLAKKITHLGTFKHSSRTTQYFGIFTAENLVETAPNPDDEELFEEFRWMKPDDIDQAIEKGEIIDGAHILAWYRYKELQRKKITE